MMSGSWGFALYSSDSLLNELGEIVLAEARRRRRWAFFGGTGDAVLRRRAHQPAYALQGGTFGRVADGRRIFSHPEIWQRAPGAKQYCCSNSTGGTAARELLASPPRCDACGYHRCECAISLNPRDGFQNFRSRVARGRVSGAGGSSPLVSSARRNLQLLHEPSRTLTEARAEACAAVTGNP
jgi:hypothetical protein